MTTSTWPERGPLLRSPAFSFVQVSIRCERAKRAISKPICPHFRRWSAHQLRRRNGLTT